VDFFRAPDRVQGILDRSLLKLLIDPSASLGGIAARGALSIVSRLAGDRVLGEIRSLDLQSSLEGIPERSMILVTERLPSHEQLRLPVEFVQAACPWVEEITLSGALPVTAMKRIEEWLR